MSKSTSWLTKPAQLALGLLLAAAVTACGSGSSGEKPRSNVQFTLGSTDSRLASALAAAAEPTNPPAAMLVTIETAEGLPVHDLLRLDVVRFGAGYVSQNLELEIGRYRLVQFLVVDEFNETIYAAPVDDPWADPELLARVSKPLPIEFEVVPGVLSGQAVEVLPVVDGQTPREFGYATFTFRPGGFNPRSATRVQYGPGEDLVFFTEDDQVTSYNFTEFFADGYTRTDRWFVMGATPDGRGPDGIWFTPDDAPLGWWWEQGKGEWGSHHDLGAGLDGIRVTTDDPISGWEQFDLRWDGFTRINGIYSDKGPDGVWRTTDDVLGGYLKMEVDANGAETKRIRYSSPGEDGAWFTPDDEVGRDWFGAYVVNTYLDDSKRWDAWARQVSYLYAGEDGVFLTPDDPVWLCRTHEFADGTQFWTRELVMTPGEDETCFTGDDEVVGYSLGTNTY